MTRELYMRLFIGLLCGLLLATCGDIEQGQSGVEQISLVNTGRPLVVASNYPLFYFARQIAGDSADAPQIVFPEIPDDPAFWIPSSDQILLLQSADLILLNGAGYESWLDWVTLNRKYLFDTSAGFANNLIELDESLTHQHGPSGEHAHQGVAFTTWLDPSLAKEQADAVANALQRLAPNQTETFRNNLSALQARLDKIDSELADAFAVLGEQPILFSHPVYQYLQRRYGLNGVSLHWEPDVEPGTGAWIEFQKLLRQYPATIMLWEAEPLPVTAARLSQQGVRSVVFQTVSNRSGQSDYFEILSDNVEQLSKALD